MGRDLGKYTKVQIVLYRIFEILIFTIGVLLLKEIFSKDGVRSTVAIVITGTALITSVLIIINSRWVNIWRLFYLSLYIYEAFTYEHYVEGTIKLLVAIPMVLFLTIKIFPKKDKTKWLEFTRLNLYESNKTEEPKNVILYGVLLGTMSFLLTHLFSSYIKFFDDYTLSGLFFSFLTLSGFLFNWYNKNQSIMKWPYGLIYHSLVFYMWLKTPHSYAMDLYCAFWLVYNVLGCIEAFYIREFDLENPSIFELDIKAMEHRRERKNTGNKDKY